MIKISPTLKLFIKRDQRLWRLKGLRNRAVPSDGLSRRVGFGLTLGQFWVEDLTMQIAELHLVMVQQAKTPYRSTRATMESLNFSTRLNIYTYLYRVDFIYKLVKVFVFSMCNALHFNIIYSTRLIKHWNNYRNTSERVAYTNLTYSCSCQILCQWAA